MGNVSVWDNMADMWLCRLICDDIWGGKDSGGATGRLRGSHCGSSRGWSQGVLRSVSDTMRHSVTRRSTCLEMFSPGRGVYKFPYDIHLLECIPVLSWEFSQSFTVSLAESLWALDACDDCGGAHPPGGSFHVVPGFRSDHSHGMISRLPHCFGNRWLENASRCCTYDFLCLSEILEFSGPCPCDPVHRRKLRLYIALWSAYCIVIVISCGNEILICFLLFLFADMDMAEKNVDVFRTNPCQSGACELWRKSFHVLKSFTRSTVQETSGFFSDGTN